MSADVRAELLAEALQLVNGDRNVAYGEPAADFETTAGLWQAYIDRIIAVRGGLLLEPHDVAALMILLKVSRIAQTPDKRDHWVDAAGYAACGFDSVGAE